MDQQNHNMPQAIGDAESVPNPVATTTPYQATYQHLYHQKQQQQLRTIWTNQYREIEQTTDFKNHNLPLARIKKIMKADEDVQMIAAEVSLVFARACEMFILELTHRGWTHAEKNERQSLQKNDIVDAVSQTDIFDFLVDIVPTNEGGRDEAVPKAISGGAIDSLHYYVQQ
ncbi:hypothetical protein IEQ34_008754 [Dendrobium chrysotoxum]|uniref:Transcription factor CBF/NF-Y/archaeal histone domain-containing protein n=1 Tax=Dendrobium chrysotoxum TaxID=161865 RepID=A0AAV7H0F7_DENCH|nr:hypothetical protein IEQ34_008754 [Dendrobium chrysotoxum]